MAGWQMKQLIFLISSLSLFLRFNFLIFEIRYNYIISPFFPPSKFSHRLVLNLFSQCFCMHINVCIYIYFSNYSLFSMYNVTACMLSGLTISIVQSITVLFPGGRTFFPLSTDNVLDTKSTNIKSEEIENLIGPAINLRFESIIKRTMTKTKQN